MANVIIMLLVLGYCAYIIYSHFIKKKGGCGCGCAGCSGCSSQTHQHKKEK